MKTVYDNLYDALFYSNMEFIQSADAFLDRYELFADTSLLEVGWNFLVLGIFTIAIGFVTTKKI